MRRFQGARRLSKGPYKFINWSGRISQARPGRPTSKRQDVIMQDKPRRSRNLRTGGYLGIERKFLDTYASNLTVNAPTDCSSGEMQPEGGCTGCLSAPAQGDGESNRDGRKILIKSCWVEGLITSSVLHDQADVAPAATIFIALVGDCQTNGATIVSEQVFTNPNDTAATNAFPLRNLEYSSRYRVLAHKTIQMGPPFSGTDGTNTLSLGCNPRRFTLAWKGNVPVNFTNTTADVANVADNSLHIIAFATNTNYVPLISYNARVRFVG